MPLARLMLIALAVVLAFLAAANVASARVSLGWASLGCFELAELVP